MNKLPLPLNSSPECCDVEISAGAAFSPSPLRDVCIRLVKSMALFAVRLLCVARVAMIGKVCNPLQIANGVIQTIQVSVIYYVAFWARAYKSFRNSRMNSQRGLLVIAPEIDCQVPTVNQVRLYRAKSAVIATNTPNITEGRDFVPAFPSNDGSPFFEWGKMVLHRVTSGVMRQAVRAALPLLIIAVSCAITTSTVMAFEPHNVRLWPGVSSSPTTVKVGATGEQTWEAVDSYGFPDWEGIVSRALDSGSPDTNSLANTYNRFLASENRGQITIRKARPGETPDIRHTAASTAFVEAKCGSGSYTACVFLLNNLTVPAFYKAPLMLTYGAVGRAATIRHEDNHAFTRSCDQYRGGCPRASDGVWESEVVCTGNPDTLMDCGGAAITATRFDYETLLLAYPPSTPFLQVQMPPPCENPCWNGDTWEFDPPYLGYLKSFDPDDGCGRWFDVRNRLVWGGCDPSWDARWNDLMKCWVGRESLFCSDLWFAGKVDRP